MTKNKRKKLILIDSNALIHRAFHALPPLTTKDGTPSGAVYGVALTLLSVFEKFKPDYVIAAFDLKGKTFRHEKFKEYKAKRVKAPDELYEQIPVTRQLMDAFGIPVFEKKGFEADDIIGTISKDKKLNGEIERIIVTGDMDTLQLVDDDTKVFTLRRGIKDTFIYDEQQVRNRFKLEPEQIVDYKALRGDPSDNIPGVAGIGEKGATQLLQKFKTLDGVFGNLEKIEPEGLRKKLEQGKKDAYLSQELAQIQMDVPVDLELDDARADQVENSQKLVDFFEKLGFSSLVRRIDKDGKTTKSKKPQHAQIELIGNADGLKKLEEKANKEKRFAYYPLAESDKYYEATCLGLGVYAGGGKSCFVGKADLPKLRKLFESKEVEKVGFNVKLDLQIVEEGMNNFQDVQIMAYLLGQNASDLEKLALKEFGVEFEHADATSGQTNLLSQTDESKKKNAAEKAFWISKLFEIYQNRFGGEGLRGVYEKLELPLIPILARMEKSGVKVEKEILKKVSALAEKKLKELEREIFDLAGTEFNINSPSQLAPVLYDQLGISTAEIKKGKTGFSTDADQLRKIRDVHPIVPLIEQYREFFKVKSTYADALPALVGKDGRIHAHFNQAVAATGRLSSSDPNLQNIPKKGKLADLIRKSFVAGEKKLLVSADYSQIDLRVAAHLSGDAKMVEAFENDRDIHRATAGWVNGIPQKKVSEKQRNEAKSLNFGILYGMGQYGFMRDSGVSGKRAKHFIENYKQTFSGLSKFLEKTKAFAREKGYVETQLGRKRHIPNVRASNAILQSAAERMAVNLPIQGLAADIMKLAMIEADLLLKKYNQKGTVVEMILQIHDELIFEIDEEKADGFAKEIKKAMEGVYQLKVPLKVDVSSGQNWQEL